MGEPIDMPKLLDDERLKEIEHRLIWADQSNLRTLGRALYEHIQAMRALHDARITELLAANNAEVERRRAAERDLEAALAPDEYGRDYRGEL